MMTENTKYQQYICIEKANGTYSVGIEEKLSKPRLYLMHFDLFRRVNQTKGLNYNSDF